MSTSLCARYLRSSKDRHDVAIDAQRTTLAAIEAKAGLACVAEFADAVERADDWQRPEFSRLLREIEHGKPQWRTLLVLDASRLARSDDYLAAYFRYQCQKRGIRILFAKFPPINPMQDLMVQTMDQLFSKVHSMISREKGLAGMAENVRAGWRAGGVAPHGYSLEKVATGAVRDGAAVTKSRLVPNSDAPAIAAYLKARAGGLPARQAARSAGLKLSPSSLVDVEWRALTYAGATVWNQTRSRGLAGAYQDGTKRRPRAEWQIQPGTHAALITQQEAEQILRRLEEKRAMRSRGDAYLLSGLLVDGAGRRWHGDQGYYRCAGKRLKAAALEQQILDHLGRELATEAIVAQSTRLARNAAAPGARDAELKSLQRQAADLERKIGRVRLVMTEMQNPGAMAPQLEALVASKAAIDERAAALAGELEPNRVMRLVTEDDVRALLGNFTEALKSLDRAHVKARLRAMLSKIVVDPQDLSTRIHYAIPAGAGDSVASPRRAAGNPAIRIVKPLQLHGFRRAA
jgi:site-specific DNA recombinase